MLSACDSLQDLTDSAVSLTDNLRDQRIKAENDKKRFHDGYRRAYRALYCEYIMMRRLVHSCAWWHERLDSKDRDTQMTALEYYYDGTHPFCTMEMRTNASSILIPSHPSTTIADAVLFGKEEMENDVRNCHSV